LNDHGGLFFVRKVDRPPVKVVDLSVTGRGLSLIAARAIPRGEVIYTEPVATVASKIPQQSQDDGCFSTRGCQNWFRSLETITSLQISSGEEHLLPSPELWPVLDFEFEDADHNTHTTLRQNKHGRLQCLSCRSWFFSKGCHSNFSLVSYPVAISLESRTSYPDC